MGSGRWISYAERALSVLWCLGLVTVLPLLPVVTAVAGSVDSTCPGDCNFDGRVEVDELVQGLAILLGKEALDLCPPLDSNQDEQLHIDELVTAVERSLNGCRGTPTPTDTPTETPTASPTATNTPIPGPEIVFFGVTFSDDSLVAPEEMEPGKPPVYRLNNPSGFSLVIEARASGPCSCTPRCECVGTRTFDFFGIPDLQVQTTRPLGNGSPEVCDNDMSNPGGVPGIETPLFDDSPEVAEVLNDLGCRFIDGNGLAKARGCTEQACIRFSTGEFGCQSPEAKFQYCGFMTAATTFPPGDTLVSARVLDVDGKPGPVAQLIIRIAPPP